MAPQRKAVALACLLLLAAAASTHAKAIGRRGLLRKESIKSIQHDDHDHDDHDHDDHDHDNFDHDGDHDDHNDHDQVSSSMPAPAGSNPASALFGNALGNAIGNVIDAAIGPNQWAPGGPVTSPGSGSQWQLPGGGGGGGGGGWWQPPNGGAPIGGGGGGGWAPPCGTPGQPPCGGGGGGGGGGWMPPGGGGGGGGGYWQPPSGWAPPPGWQPPPGWTPPSPNSGWVPPPGWGWQYNPCVCVNNQCIQGGGSIIGTDRCSLLNQNMGSCTPVGGSQCQGSFTDILGQLKTCCPSIAQG